MPTRSQCSACELIERLSASLASRRLSCIRSEIFTMPISALHIYVPYMKCISTPSGPQDLQRPHRQVQRHGLAHAADDLEHAIAVDAAGVERLVQRIDAGDRHAVQPDDQV